jgi:hypothetical protein
LAISRKKVTAIALDPEDDRPLAGRCRYSWRISPVASFTYAPPTVGQLSRAMEVDRRFEDLAQVLVD